MKAEKIVRPKLLTLLCYGAMMTLAIGVNLIPVFLTSLSTAFAGSPLTQEQLGRLGAIGFGGLVLGILITGPCADRWGAKSFAIGGNVILAASLLCLSVVPDYLTLGLAVFFLGLGAGLLDMVLSPIVSVLNSNSRSSALNWLHSFYCVGAAVTILASTIALRIGLGWRNACLVLLPLPVALAIFLGQLRFPSLLEQSHDQARTELRILFSEPWFLAVLIAIFLGGANELGMAQWLPAYAENALNYPRWIGGAALLLFSIAMAAGRMAAGSFGARMDPFALMAWCCALSVLLFLLGSFLPRPALALWACIAVGFTGSALWPTLLAVSADRYPAGGASMFAALAAFGNAGGILMPWMVGWIADLRNLHWGLAFSALAPLLMLPVLVFLYRGMRKPFVASKLATTPQ